MIFSLSDYPYSVPRAYIILYTPTHRSSSVRGGGGCHICRPGAPPSSVSTVFVSPRFVSSFPRYHPPSSLGGGIRLPFPVPPRERTDPPPPPARARAHTHTPRRRRRRPPKRKAIRRGREVVVFAGFFPHPVRAARSSSHHRRFPCPPPLLPGLLSSFRPPPGVICVIPLSGGGGCRKERRMDHHHHAASSSGRVEEGWDPPPPPPRMPGFVFAAPPPPARPGRGESRCRKDEAGGVARPFPPLPVVGGGCGCGIMLYHDVSSSPRLRYIIEPGARSIKLFLSSALKTAAKNFDHGLWVKLRAFWRNTRHFTHGFDERTREEENSRHRRSK